MFSIFTISQYLYKHQGSIGKAWQYIRRHYIKLGWQPTLELLNRSLTLAHFEKWAIKADRKIIILSTPHTIFINSLVSNNLRKFNLHCEFKVSSDRNYNTYEDALYIIICPQYFNHLPELYISYQLEQTVSDRWFDQTQIKKLKKSLFVLDYSLKNIAYLSEHLPLSQLYYCPIDAKNLDIIHNTPNNHSDYQYDILFYGDTHNERRQHILNELGQHFNLKVINNAFGSEIWDEIKKAKIILNIHYYENALLETTRLYECLSNGALIISETSQDLSEHQNLNQLIDFVDENNTQQFIERIRYWLTHPDAFIERKKAIFDYYHREQTQFDFFFNRALLALDLISFNTFYDSTHHYINFTSNFLCLGLPESSKRQIAFKAQQSKVKIPIQHFPGVRHLTPWIGCGMSYKYMLKYAKEKQLSMLSICEDDVIFTEEFIENFNTIEQFLQHTPLEWQIFSGHITDLAANAHIETLQPLNQLHLIQVNKTTGMVFNIYHPRSFSIFENWDEYNHDIQSNTIDRYLENQASLNVISTVPYLVEHDETIETTLWNRKISKECDYSNLIEKTKATIDQKINR